MKKILLPLLIIGFILVSCKKNNLSDSYWLAIKSYPIPPETGNSIYDGLIIHFTDNKLISSNVYSQKEGNYAFKSSNKKILINDTLWASIYAKSEDSLILEIRDNARVKFIKLDKKHSIDELPNLWDHKNWVLFYDDFQRGIYLTDEPFLEGAIPKLCIQKNLQKNQFINTIDKWNIVNINGNQIFAKSFYQMSNEFFRIKNYVGDSVVEIEALNLPKMNVFLKKQRYINNIERQKKLSLIQNRTWTIDSVIQLDTIAEGSGRAPYKILNLESLKGKQIKFEFGEDFAYNIYEFNRLVTTGNWRLSPTGNEIILNNGINPSDYIDLIKLSEDNLVIGNLRLFEPSTSNYSLKLTMYYKVSLKNNGG